MEIVQEKLLVENNLKHFNNLQNLIDVSKRREEKYTETKTMGIIK